MALPTSAASGGPVFWVGQDGNVYAKGYPGQSGVVNAGKLVNSSGNSFSTIGGDGLTAYTTYGTQIADPDPGGKPPPGPAAPSNPNGGSGGGSASTYVDKSNDISLNQGTADTADQVASSGIAKINAALDAINGQYATEDTNESGSVGQAKDTNTNNLESGKESALVNAARGRRGLFGTLAGLGALNGSGIDLANRAVQTGANADLAGAQNTYAGNDTNIASADKLYQTEDQERKLAASQAADAARTQAQNDAAKTKQAAYVNIANDYQQEGDTGNASKYTSLAKGLLGDIANSSQPTLTSLTPQSIAFTAPTLSNYLVNGNTAVNTTAPSGANGVPGLFAGLTPNQKKQPVGV